MLEVENFPNGCHVCELEIDPETGEVEIVRYSVVDDVGTVINPLLLHGQIVGGVAQGVGQILMEDIRFDADRASSSPARSWTTPCRAPTTSRASQVKSNPVPTKTNPLGVKGCGEAGCVGAMPAVANAIVDALSELGVRHIEMPATPERVWRAINDSRGRRIAEGVILAAGQILASVGRRFDWDLTCDQMVTYFRAWMMCSEPSRTRRAEACSTSCSRRTGRR